MPSSLSALKLFSSGLLLVHTAAALEVTPGSSCASFCLDRVTGDSFNPAASSTGSSDITCSDLDFSQEEAGIKFQNCLECLQTSEKVNGTESDLHWYLYNLRFALSSCLFSIPNEPVNYVGSPCVLDYACEPLRDSLSEDDFDPDNQDAYGYCSANDGVFERRYRSCVGCLQASTEQTYLSNFVVALHAGCEQRPEPGTLLGLSESIFTSSPVNVTDPADDVLNRPEGAGSSTMTTGTIVGIAVGAGLLFLGAIALFIVYWRRKKRLEQESEKTDYYGRNTSTPDPFLPPEGSKMTDSLRSHSGQSNYPKEIMTTGEYHDRVDEETRSRALSYNFDPRQRNRGPGSAFQTHMAYDPRAMSRLEMEGSRGYNPSPPPAAHTRSKSNPTDSYALRTYISSTDDHVASGFHPPPPPMPQQGASQHPSAPANVPPPPSYPPSQQSSVPSLVLPSLGKLRLPKKYSPPTMASSKPSSVSSSGNGTQAVPEIKISQPVMSGEQRFQDRPLAGGSVFATDATIAQANQQVSPERVDYPVRSGQSTLYGM
ncbi:hypothetical protein B0I35DRAFT_479072 [Stachybotrys elegans]|uniref:LPXTG-domain-containing protein n=1 Tax=Stachybotrys elegans TaxID=80388 RepID=A0A8K0WRB1_9HYPO|nr:hypothetical protein B0I35DRAFT_479072 [Stachybotrys elegans]